MQRLSNRNRSRRRSGFTLLEVLLVVGILALLAAAIVPSLMNVQDSAERKTTMNRIAALKTPLSLYRQAMGNYPDELSQLNEKPEDEDQASKWEGPYLEDLETLKDAWGNELQYRGPEDAEFREGQYDLWSLGKDGEDGTDDDITNWNTDE